MQGRIRESSLPQRDPMLAALRADGRRRANISDGFERGIVPALVYVFGQLRGDR